MSDFLAIAAVLLIGAAWGEDHAAASVAPLSGSAASPIEARFVARVTWIEPIGKRKATVVPVGPDPRWLAALDIISIEKPERLFEKKGRVVLAIHSPTRLFAANDKDAVGRAYSFRIAGILREGRPSYHSAAATLKTPSGS